MIKKICTHCYLFVVAFVFLQTKGRCQDIHFSQFFETQIMRNPALAGVFTGDVRATLGYRDQWNSFTNAYHTGFGSAEIKIPVGQNDNYFSFGAYANYDKSGSIGLSTLHIMPTLNYFKSLSTVRPMFLSIGFSAGMFQRSFDASKITTNSQYIGSQYVPSASIGENFSYATLSKLDASAGIAFNTQLGDAKLNNLFIGVGLHHITKPNVSFYNDRTIVLAPKININAGYKFAIDDYSYITMQADFSNQKKYNELLAGAIYSRNLTDDADYEGLAIHGGLMARIGDAIIPIIKIDFQKYTLGFSYDANVSSLRKVSYGRGGYECTISYKAWRKKTSQEEKKMNCPKF